MSGTELSFASRGLLEVIFQANVTGEPARQSWKHPIIKELERKDLIAGDGGIDSDNRQSYTVTDKGAAIFGGWPQQKDENEVNDAVTHDAEPEAETATSEPVTSAEPKKRSKRPTPPSPQRSEHRFAFSAFKSAKAERKPRGEEYPFASLGAPETDEESGEEMFDSFFVATSETQPNPGKYMASAVGSANKRYEGKAKFAVRSIKNDPEFGVDGARVFRVE